ncbi:Cation/H(+) antiporter 15 [Linum grandiflorum]
MSSALINDICAWILLALAIAMSSVFAEDENASLASLWIIASSVLFVLVCFFIIRPGIDCMIKRTPEGDSFNEFYICLILTGVMIFTSLYSSLRHHRCFKKKSGEEK